MSIPAVASRADRRATRQTPGTMFFYGSVKPFAASRVMLIEGQNVGSRITSYNVCYTKLLRVITTTIVIILASAAFVALEINNYRRALVQRNNFV